MSSFWSDLILERVLPFSTRCCSRWTGERLHEMHLCPKIRRLHWNQPDSTAERQPEIIFWVCRNGRLLATNPIGPWLRSPVLQIFTTKSQCVHRDGRMHCWKYCIILLCIASFFCSHYFPANFLFSHKIVWYSCFDSDRIGSDCPSGSAHLFCINAGVPVGVELVLIWL
jgi:hypothetical protein